MPELVAFENADAIDIEQKVLSLLKGFLQTKFGAVPYAARFTRYAGIGITVDDTQAAKWWNGKKPFIFLSIASGEHDLRPYHGLHGGVIRTGTMHVITVTAEVITSDFSGNKIGASNPVSSTQLMRDALNHIADNGTAELRAIGLHGVTIRPDRMKAMDPQIFNPHNISLRAYTLKPAA